MNSQKRFLILACVIFMVSGIFAQHAVKGTVVDSKSQETIIGASVVVEGTTIGTTTDFDGNFSLSAPIGSVYYYLSILIIHCIYVSLYLLINA